MQTKYIYTLAEIQPPHKMWHEIKEHLRRGLKPSTQLELIDEDSKHGY